MNKLNNLLSRLRWALTAPAAQLPPQKLSASDDFADIDDPEQLRAIINAVYDGAAAWERQCRGAEKLLHMLLKLKHRKDTVGKDAYYLEHQPELWRMVHQYLKLYGYDVSTIPPP